MPDPDSSRLVEAPRGNGERKSRAWIWIILLLILVGGVIGYYLDKWLHTDPWMMVVFGGFGFVAGVVEIGRRLRPGKSNDGSGNG